ncbi:hypothetical protein FRC10_003547 [Ceratobasidium sp. 414]|nr:hypothetical protein FRC10_003547 [Ceratobasidium sp. 414]
MVRWNHGPRDSASGAQVDYNQGRSRAIFYSPYPPPPLPQTYLLFYATMGSMLSYGGSAVQTDLSGKVFIVTGANRGIGFETAKQLYKLGGTVYLGARSEKNAEDAIARIHTEVTSPTEGELRWFSLDLGTIGRAKESAEAFLEMEDRHVGHFVLTTTLLPLMKKTSALNETDVRVVASTVHNMWGKGTQISFVDPSDLSKPFPLKKPDTWSHILTRYSRTKLANILFTRELQRRLDDEGSSIITLSVHPGYVATGKFCLYFPLPLVVTFSSPDAAIEATSKMPIFGLLSSVFVKLFFIDEAGGARNSVYAASDPDVRADPRRFKGQFLTPVGKVTAPAAIAQDKQLARDLWTLTDKIMQQRINP